MELVEVEEREVVDRRCSFHLDEYSGIKIGDPNVFGPPNIFNAIANSDDSSNLWASIRYGINDGSSGQSKRLNITGSQTELDIYENGWPHPIGIKASHVGDFGQQQWILYLEGKDHPLIIMGQSGYANFQYGNLIWTSDDDKKSNVPGTQVNVKKHKQGWQTQYFCELLTCSPLFNGISNVGQQYLHNNPDATKPVSSSFPALPSFRPFLTQIIQKCPNCAETQKASFQWRPMDVFFDC